MTKDIKDEENEKEYYDFTEEHGIHTTIITKVDDFLNEAIRLPGKGAKTEHVILDKLYVSCNFTIFANGSSEKAKGYVSIEFKDFRIRRNMEGCLIISVIDLSNTQNFSQSFPFTLSYERNFSFVIEKYVSRELLLSDSHEYLPNDVLTLMFDVQLRNKGSYDIINTSLGIFQYLTGDLITGGGSEMSTYQELSQDYYDSLLCELHLDSPLTERISQESNVFKEMLELKSKEGRGTITIKKEERLPFLYVCKLLMGCDVLYFDSIQDVFDVYIVSDKYNIKCVMDACTCFWKLYASVHGVEELFECVNKYESELLKEILVNQIILVSKTKLEEEFRKRFVDVTMKKPVHEWLWSYEYVDANQTTFLTRCFHRFININSDWAVMFYQNKEERDNYNFYK